MTCQTSQPDTVRPNQTESAIEDVVRVYEKVIDEETLRFIEEVLKAIPEEPSDPVELVTSMRGTWDASQVRHRQER